MPTNTGFGFDVSPNGGTGTLSIIILTPNNDGSFSADRVTGNGFTAATAFGSSGGLLEDRQLGRLPWHQRQSGQSDWRLPAAGTERLHSGATGFNVYVLHDTMLFSTWPGPLSGPASLPDEFTLAGALPMGSFIDGFFQQVPDKGLSHRQLRGLVRQHHGGGGDAAAGCAADVRRRTRTARLDKEFASGSKPLPCLLLRNRSTQRGESLQCVNYS